MRSELSVSQEAVAFAADIRALYGGVLRWAAAQGHKRPIATTPAELAQRFAGVRPEVAAPVALITRHYELARYGERDISAEALALRRDAAKFLGEAGTRPGIGAQDPS